MADAPSPPWMRTGPASSGPIVLDKPEKPATGRKVALPIDPEALPSTDVVVLPPTADAPEMSFHEKQLCERFAREYIIDFNQTRAGLRMGYKDQNVASNMGNRLFWKPYTQAYLVMLIRSIEEKTIISRNDVLAGLLREANSYGPDANSATRIAAWREIGKIMGMYIAKVEISQNNSGVMEVPIVRNSNEFEALSAGSQAALMNAVRE